MKYLKKLFGIKDDNQILFEKIHQNKYLKEKIYYFDKSGEEFYTTKSLWLQNILIPDLKNNYDNPNNLYNLIVGALQDGFDEFLIDSSCKLYEIDENRERAGCIYAIVLIKNKQLEQAKEILENTINTIGKTGILLTNLAKVHAEFNNWEIVENILIEALEIDPNQDNGLDWYLSIHRENEGEEGYKKALNRISKFNNAWRPLVYLADISIENKDIDTTMHYYKKLINIEQNLPSDVLMQISGNLGINNYINEMITVVEPIFNPNLHEFSIANNLIKAYITTNKYEKANNLLNHYLEQNNPTIKKDLEYWKNELKNKI